MLRSRRPQSAERHANGSPRTTPHTRGSARRNGTVSPPSPPRWLMATSVSCNAAEVAGEARAHTIVARMLATWGSSYFHTLVNLYDASSVVPGSYGSHNGSDYHLVTRDRPGFKPVNATSHSDLASITAGCARQPTLVPPAQPHTAAYLQAPLFACTTCNRHEHCACVFAFRIRASCTPYVRSIAK